MSKYKHILSIKPFLGNIQHKNALNLYQKKSTYTVMTFY